ncbi:hypothetical protein SHY52_11075, partial [Streptococcus suis]|nr:hypothetical protein [Streptococcus suis]
ERTEKRLFTKDVCLGAIINKVAKPLVAKSQRTGGKKATKTSKGNNELIATLRREVETRTLRKYSS